MYISIHISIYLSTETKQSYSLYQGKPQKSYYFGGPATKRGGGGKGRATKKK